MHVHQPEWGDLPTVELGPRAARRSTAGALGFGSAADYLRGAGAAPAAAADTVTVEIALSIEGSRLLRAVLDRVRRAIDPDLTDGQALETLARRVLAPTRIAR